ncbi:fumarylacetoacetate hydrolase family protein [Halorhodospira neutriphila]|uniref:5-carboxymethyl-2-hydroxymuconate isomerase n=1 Tax=Halorhodospira neutriphila TaxID=168379 RepID=A0ABS1E868_9GAMM|nr:fumarylacetoacetate hydrolase family protein [Halorhodospira neutriphila]MBK1727369.1 5-carboxymethyl-2-hydroxymuconate isomerase [Halorhodospira neutriphila]
MRITTVGYGAERHIAVARSETQWQLCPEPGDLGAALERGAVPGPQPHWPLVDAAELELLAPIPAPRRNVICLGLNYAEHAAESQRAKGAEWALPSDLVVFTKATTTVTGPYAEITLDPAVTEQLDWEVELAAVIGRGGRHIPAERAAEHVFGYTVVNDLSARDLQFRHKQFFLGKSVDGTCPMGPWITTADAVPDPHALTLSCRVNGVLKQHACTSGMIATVPQIVAGLSRVLTLEPGDIIATGTPSGVGFARQPPEYLAPGDRVTSEVEGLGRLENRLASPPDDERQP